MLWAQGQRITITVLNERPPADGLPAAYFRQTWHRRRQLV